MAFNKSKALEEAGRLVSQRKLPEAIRQYLAIAEKDPEDLSLLNTTGDLCVRAGNVPEALRQFNKLAAAYSRDGFILKAIAIYKKIAKLDTQSADSFLKLAELYTSQGLSREAREQYVQALAFCQARRLEGKTLQILTQLLSLDPSNAAYHMRRAELYETAGKREDALEEYLEAARLADRQRNATLAGAALAKARGIDQRHLKVLLWELRRAAEEGRFEEARQIYESAPEMRSDHEAKLIFLSALLAGGKLDEGLNVAIEAYRDHTAGFEPLDRFINHCLDAGNPDAALEPLKSVAELALDQNAEKLVNSLHRIAAQKPRHAACLDWMEEICMRAAGAAGWTEALEAIAKAYGEAGEWEKARRIYSGLLKTDEQNPHWQSLLNAAFEKQGEMKPAAPGEAARGSHAGSLEAKEAKSPVESHGSPANLRAPLSPMPAVEMDFSKEWQGFTSRQTSFVPPSAPATMDSDEEEVDVEDNPQTHYHLGIAFREMGLLDEAIGEFQKVVKGTGKESFPPNFLGACSLLGLCFLEKSEPRIAAQWYLRGFEAPDTDEETSMALNYGLASAYEQLGDSKAALEKFAEVYSLNVDYRDVAEKIRMLRQRQPDH